MGLTEIAALLAHDDALARRTILHEPRIIYSLPRAAICIT